MNEQRKNNGRGIFYGVIGVATLVVAIIGATFAYFTATAQGGENEITGNMASITFNVEVEKVTTVDEIKGGMIPMSNSMVQAAVAHSGSGENNGACVDDNGNAVCQIYKATVTNTGSASLFVDGYITLTDKTTVAPTDVESGNWTNLSQEGDKKTVMRWAEVFTTNETTFTTVGHSKTGATGGTGIGTDWTALDLQEASVTSTSGFYRAALKNSGVTGTGTISGNTYDIINTNYIRYSDHKVAEGSTDTYSRTSDVTSALVFNQNLAPSDGQAGGSDEVVYYFVVWLSETGTNQNPETSDEKPNPNALNFFNGKVYFVSAQGSEVTATFSSYSRVKRTD